MKVNDAISKRIQGLLIEKDITQYRLAKNVAMSPQTLVNIMSGKRDSANAKTIILIARGFGITVSEFYNDPIFESKDLEID